jgi:hypothetical protein
MDILDAHRKNKRREGKLAREGSWRLSVKLE